MRNFQFFHFSHYLLNNIYSVGLSHDFYVFFLHRPFFCWAGDIWEKSRVIMGSHRFFADEGQ